MKIKTSELIDAALDFAVALARDESVRVEGGRVRFALSQFTNDYDLYSPSTDWEQAGPLLQAEMMEHGMSLSSLDHGQGKFAAHYWSDDFDEIDGIGPTPLIAAMRALVQRKLGDEVDVPDEFVEAKP